MKEEIANHEINYYLGITHVNNSGCPILDSNKYPYKVTLESYSLKGHCPPDLWCIENVNTDEWRWCYAKDESALIYYFVDIKVAMEFRLTWDN